MADKMELGFFRIRMILKLTIITHPFIISEYPDAISEVMGLKQTRTVQDYYEELKGFCNLLQLTEEDAVQIFINNLNPNISKLVRFFCPNSLTHALKLAKQLESLYDEQPNEHSSPDSNTTPVKQQIISTPPKQSSSPTILTKPTNSFMETTVNPFFPLNSFPISEMLAVEEGKKLKHDEVLSEMVIGHTKYLTAGSLLSKNILPYVARYKVGFVDVCKKFEGEYSRVFVIENRVVTVYDPYGFRLLVMEMRNNSIEVVEITINPKGRNMIIGQSLGAQTVIKDGVKFVTLDEGVVELWDLSMECVWMLERLMLAQAQEYVFENTITNGSTHGICAKISRQVGLYYEEALAALNTIPLKNHFEKVWIAQLQLKAALFYAEVCYREIINKQSIMVAKESQNATDSPKIEVGEIDTSVPFQSVKDVVTLFGEGVFSGEKPAIKKEKPHSADRVLANETQLHLAQKELNKLKEQPENSETTKAQALVELERATKTVEELTHKLKNVNESKDFAIKVTKVAKNQAKQIEEAEHTAQVNMEKVGELSRELSSIQESIGQVKLASLEAQQEQAKMFTKKDTQRQLLNDTDLGTTSPQKLANEMREPLTLYIG